MPMLRVLASENWRAMDFDLDCSSVAFMCRSPTIVRESLVGLGHAVRVLTLFHSVALVARSIEQLGCETVGHGTAWTLARVLDQPPHAHRLASIRTDFHRHLIGRATDAARAH